MSIIRQPRGQGANGIQVKCPRCHAPILITAVHRQSPIRCTKCSYPLLLQSDFRSVIAACLKIRDAAQVKCAFAVLSVLAESTPEAGTALGKLANQYTLSISEKERWGTLLAAYHSGDLTAREWLDQLCRSYPQLYGREYCSQCGAPRYIEKNYAGKALCPYCKHMD